MATAGRRCPAALALAAAVIALAACGSSDDTGPSEGTEATDVQGVGPARGGSTAQLANCRNWRRGTVEQRYATIEDIRGRAESALSDEAAYRIFQKTCSASFSDSLRIYKLYDRAEAFAPLTGDASE